MNNAAIGVFDSGVGGLTVVKELAALMPREKIIYFGDTARAPYGSRPPEEIREFMHEILHFFSQQKVKMAVCACNTMTALGLEEARHKYPFQLVGMNTGARSALAASRNNKIGVVATQAAIASGKHENSMKALDETVDFYPVACPKFVPLIEQGLLCGSELEEAVREYVTPLSQAGVDALILGCTHYPLISNAILKVMGPGVTLINPAGETARDAVDALKKNCLAAASGKGAVRIGFSVTYSS
ncbi:MAG: murI [Firmicutes bacterium]|nr:murI [Bacillota bacterium]